MTVRHALAAFDEAENIAPVLAELARRVRAYRGDRPPLDVRGRTVILVDDGLATGVTARAAMRARHAQMPSRIVFAAPVCAPSPARLLGTEFDEVVCAAEPAELHAVGIWYDDFSQTSDEEVVALLRHAWHGEQAAALDLDGERRASA